MTPAKFLKSGVAAAMVLFAASSFAGPTTIKDGDLEARLDIGMKTAAINYGDPGMRVGDDFGANGQFKGGLYNFSWTNGKTYRFVSEYDAASGAVTLDILQDMTTQNSAGYSAFSKLSYSEAAAKGNGFYKVGLNVKDNKDVNINFTNLMFNGKLVNGGIWDTDSEALYAGKALDKYKVEGLFTVTGTDSTVTEVVKINGQIQYDKTVYQKFTSGANKGQDKPHTYGNIDTSLSIAKTVAVKNSNLLNDSYFNVVYGGLGKVGTEAALVPEPTTLALLPLALGGAFLASRRRKAAAK
ncbi:PEP-CTERM sorting domain-containing protein [Paucibacter sp. B2R-40]|uniref:PEP-CTERM sorting domain-containing protein n=1 Tax=Paucibacter sp. B2R-40 TaxID=2893554 RepID=UPI0021E3BFD8|nr:PEP-CTERM sorting domain-containing protein [Paucibacter sp. B2R-40]MCV2354354.1 PEP-CTERM sorting domain-containing protein [Paucibacter sp. B2R-40]